MAEYTLPPLPYDFGALEPHIDAKTMEIHHDKHHAAYVNNLNAALKDHPDHQGKPIEELIADLNALPESDPDGGPEQRRRARQPLAVLADHEAGRRRRADRRPGAGASRSELGGFAAFKEAFAKAAATRFGSGWAWLVVGKDGKLAVTSTPNQDSPIMDGADPDPRPRRLGARLLPQVPEPPARLRRRLVEHGQLGRGEPPLRRRQGLSRVRPSSARGSIGKRPVGGRLRPWRCRTAFPPHSIAIGRLTCP